MACGVGEELYVFGGVRTHESDDPELEDTDITCKSELYHNEIRRSVKTTALFVDHVSSMVVFLHLKNIYILYTFLNKLI